MDMRVKGGCKRTVLTWCVSDPKIPLITNHKLRAQGDVILREAAATS